MTAYAHDRNKDILLLLSCHRFPAATEIRAVASKVGVVRRVPTIRRQYQTTVDTRSPRMCMD